MFKHERRGYSHTIGFNPGVTAAIASASVRYRIAFDVALFGLVTCALARADVADLLEFTLYVPMRDGVTEAMVVGLFSDWRDLSVSVDFELATVLGTLLQINHKILHREWTVFNALRKPDRTFVNIQPLDFQQRAGFLNLGQNLWRRGDSKLKADKRGPEMGWARQPLNFVIEQQDTDIWWVLVSADYEERPTPWMRRFVHAYQEALRAFLLEPLTLVHALSPPDDARLLKEQAVSRSC